MRRVIHEITVPVLFFGGSFLALGLGGELAFRGFCAGLFVAVVARMVLDRTERA